MFSFFSRGVGIFFGGSRSSGAIFTPPPASGGAWILSTGVWNDSGLWDDTQNWKDS